MKMRLPRSAAITALLALVSAGCAATVEPAPTVRLEPEPAVEEMDLEPEAVERVVPEPSLQERWRAPFAVTSRGRTAVRPERPVLAVAGTQADTAALEIPEGVDAPQAAQREGDRPVGGAATAPAQREEPDPVSQVSPAPSTGAAQGGLRTHRVEWGETWFGLSRRYGVTSAALARLNPGVDPAQLRAGEVLLIPPSETAEMEGRRHTVVAGDSLWGISRRYGVSLERLREVNRLTDDRVRIGQVLVIP